MIFENKFTRDKACFKEVFAAYYFKRPIMKIVLIIMGVYFLIFLLAIALGAFETSSIYDFALIIFAFIVFACAFVGNYHLGVHNAVKRDLELTGGEPLEMSVCISEEKIVLSDLGNNTELKLSVMKMAFGTKNYIVVITKANHMIILKKDSFTKGSSDELVEFFKQKGVKVK